MPIWEIRVDDCDVPLRRLRHGENIDALDPGRGSLVDVHAGSRHASGQQYNRGERAKVTGFHGLWLTDAFGALMRKGIPFLRDHSPNATTGVGMTMPWV